MTITVSGRHLEISNAFRQHALESLNGLWEKYHMNPVDVHVVLIKEHNDFQCDISAKLGKQGTLRCQGHGDQAYNSFDNGLSTLTKRLRRHRGKLKDIHHHAGYDKTASYPLRVLNGSSPDEGIEDHSEDAAAIIAEVQTDIATLSVAEAVMEMDLNDSEVLVFINKTHHKINIIHRRRDGNIGWIDPNPTE